MDFYLRRNQYLLGFLFLLVIVILSPVLIVMIVVEIVKILLKKDPSVVKQ